MGCGCQPRIPFAHLFRMGCVLTPSALQEVSPFQPECSFLCCGTPGLEVTAAGTQLAQRQEAPLEEILWRLSSNSQLWICAPSSTLSGKLSFSAYQISKSKVQPEVCLFCSRLPGGTRFPLPLLFPSLPCSLATHRPAFPLQPPGSLGFEAVARLLPWFRDWE